MPPCRRAIQLGEGRNRRSTWIGLDADAGVFNGEAQQHLIDCCSQPGDNLTSPLPGEL